MTKKVDEKMYKAIKTLIAGGATYDEITEYLGISSVTITRVKKSETFEDYKHSMVVAAMKYKKPKAPVETPVEPVTQVVEHRQSITIQATHYMMEELKKKNELLELISNKLSFIVDQLT